MAPSQPAINRTRSRGWEAAAVALILLFAASVHFVKIDSLPPGLHQDEAVYLVDSETILDGSPRIYYGEREPLYMYVVAGASVILGASPLTLRMTAGLFSLVEVAAGGALASQLFGRRIGLLTAAGLATSLWLTALGRTGFRAISLPAVECLGLALFWRATRTGRSRDYAMSGVVLGLSLYTYLSARFLPIALLVFVALAAVLYRSWLAKRFHGLVLAATTAFLTCLPLGYYGIRHPEIFFGRPDQVALPGGSAFLPALVDSGKRTLGMLWFYGDPTWRHNLSGAPVLDPLNSVLFAVGLVVALRRRGPSSLLLLVVLVVMLVPGMISIDSPHFLRTNGSLGAIYATWAIGLLWMAESVRRIGGSPRIRNLLGVLAIAAPITVAGVRDGWGYFVTYANDLEMPASYNVEHAAAGRVLAASPIWHANRSNVYVTDRYQQDHSSISAFLYPSLSSAERARWLDEDIVGTFIPQDELIPLPLGPSLYVTSGDGRLVKEALGDSARTDTLIKVGGGGTIDVVEADSSDSPGRGATLPVGAVSFGNVILLESASVLPVDPSVQGARTIALRWKVLGRPTYQPSLFVHVDDAKRRTLAQSDLEIRIPPSSWRPGQEWISFHQVRLPAGTLPDDYSVTVGVYNKQSGAREDARAEGRPLPIVSVLTLKVAEAIGGTPTVERRIDQIVAPGLTLLGNDPLPSRIEAGMSLPVTLAWSASAASRVDYDVRATLRTPDGKIVGAWRGPVGSGSFRTSQWVAGAGIRQTIDVPIAPTVSGGVVVSVAVSPAADASTAGSDRPGVDLGRLTVDAARHDFATPTPRKSADVGFGEVGRLIGYDPGDHPVRAGESFDLHLYWHAARASAVSYTVFVHLLDEQNRIVGQRDEGPVHATRATTSWVDGEYLDDPHTIPIDPKTPTGPYRIEVGLYDPITGVRVGTDAGLDHAIIGVLQVQGR